MFKVKMQMLEGTDLKAAWHKTHTELEEPGYTACTRGNVPLFIADASSSLDFISSRMHSVIAFHV